MNQQIIGASESDPVRSEAVEVAQFAIANNGIEMAAGETAADEGIAGRSTPSLREQVVRGGAILAARQVIGMVVSTLGMLIVTQRIGPNNYGLYVAAMGLFGYFNFVCQWGLDVYLIRKEGKIEPEDYHLGFTILLGTGIIGAIVGVCIVPLLQATAWSDAPGFGKFATCLLVGLPFTLMTLVPAAKMEREMDFQRVAIIELIALLLLHVVSVTAAFLKLGAWAPIIGWWCQLLFTVSMFYTFSTYRPRFHWNFERTKTMLSFGLGYAASMWIWQLRTLVNSMVVLPFLGTEAVGYVGLAMKFVEVLSFVKTTTWRLSVVALAKLEGNLEKATRAVTEGMQLQILGLGPVLAGFALLAPYIMPIVFRSRWQQWSHSMEIFPYIGLGVLINAIFSMHSSVLYVLQRNWQVAIFHGIHVAILLASARILVPKYGILGVGYSEVITLSSYVVVHLFTVKLVGRPDYRIAGVWAAASGLLLFAHQIGWCAWIGVVLAFAWPQTWKSLDGYVRMILGRRKGRSAAVAAV